MDNTITDSLSAALEEMQFWLRIMSDHSKLIRGGFDLSEEKYIREACSFVDIFDTLHYKSQQLEPHNEQEIKILLQESMCYTTYLRDFKARLYTLVSNCQVISKLPADLYKHVKEEADYFLSVICKIAGCPISTKKELGIDNSTAPNTVVARRFIPYYRNNILEVSHDINLFWLDRHREHGEVLLLIAFRPYIQEELWGDTQQFEKLIAGLEDEFKKLSLTTTNVLNFNQKVIPVMQNWRNYLEGLYERVFKCNVPSKGINADGSILNHMAREADYYLDDLRLINVTLSAV